ncbi:MAG: DUF4136 domain-containing protein [Bacteroidia bacterium]
MKKILIVLTVAATFVSCRNLPDFEDLTLKPIVVTNHDAEANFSNYQTYYLPPFIDKIADDANDSTVSSSLAQPILDAIDNNMQSRGYTKVTDKNLADIGIGVVTITVTTTEVYYPGYWWGYGGYYGGYGGYYPYYPYYPYSYTYTYTTGSMVVELIDLKNIDLVNNRVDILWTNFSNGVLGQGVSSSVLAVDAVNQAFKQSPYITTN